MQINSVSDANQLKSLEKKLMCSLLKVNLSNKWSCRAIKTLPLLEMKAKERKTNYLINLRVTFGPCKDNIETYRQSVWST